MNETNEIRRRFQNKEWPRLISKIKITGLRGWQGEEIFFNFPLTAIVGENGTGKSTVLKSLACAFINGTNKETFYHSYFFKSTPWDTVENCEINYTIQLPNTSQDLTVKKTGERWRFNKDRIKSRVSLLEISRTLPLDATAGYAKIAKQASSESSTEQLSEEFQENLRYILGIDYQDARFAKTDIDNKKEIGILTKESGEISQFHQGAGEDASLDLMQTLQSLPRHSLLLIDEVEASLHPRAQRRLIKFLLKYCRKNICQIVLTTHSPYILEELPSESRILLKRSLNRVVVIPNISTQYAMSHIDDEDHQELHIFVEDTSAQTWLRNIILSDADGLALLRRIGIFPAGPANVVQQLGKLAHNGGLPYPGIAIVDGDKDATEGCIKFPGDLAPEKVVFADLKNQNWPDVPERFGIGAGEMIDILDQVFVIPDHHNWCTFIGDRIRRGGNTVWDMLTRIWVSHCMSDDVRDSLLLPIKDKIQ